VQAAACAWVKSNKARVTALTRFPERSQSPFFCLRATSGGLCSDKYVAGWAYLFVQLALSLGMLASCLWLYFAEHWFAPKDTARALIEDSLAKAAHGIPDEHPAKLISSCLPGWSGKYHMGRC
jgi:hypothetical protein